MHDLPRPTLTPRRRATIGLAAGLAAIFGAGVVTTIALRPTKPPVIRVAAPATATTVLPFAVPSLVVLPAPELPAPPPPPPAPEPPPPNAPRALVPAVNASCVVSYDAPVCAWDAGFPALSADGSQIAIRYIPEDGGRGYPGLTIQLVSVKTSKVAASYVVLSPDEYLEPDDAGWTKLNAKIARRAAAAQRVLDAGQFRSLVAIDVTRTDPDTGEPIFPTNATLRAEGEGEAIRIIDTAANTVLWQRQFPVKEAYPAAKNPMPDGEGCYPSSTREIGVAWDPHTRLLLAAVSYASGPCYCGDEIAYHVTTI